MGLADVKDEAEEKEWPAGKVPNETTKFPDCLHVIITRALPNLCCFAGPTGRADGGGGHHATGCRRRRKIKANEFLRMTVEIV